MNDLFGTIEERIVRGIDRLDRHRPDWDLTVDCEVLDVRKGDVCPLGQAFGGSPESYSVGTWALGIDDMEAIRCGFLPLDDWEEMNAAWVDAIVSRRYAEVLQEVFV